MGIEFIQLALVSLGGFAFYWQGLQSGKQVAVGWYMLSLACMFGVAGILQVQGIQSLAYTNVNLTTGTIVDVYTNVRSGDNLAYMIWQWLSIGFGFLSVRGAIVEALDI